MLKHVPLTLYLICIGLSGFSAAQSESQLSASCEKNYTSKLKGTTRANLLRQEIKHYDRLYKQKSCDQGALDLFDDRDDQCSSLEKQISALLTEYKSVKRQSAFEKSVIAQCNKPANQSAIVEEIKSQNAQNDTLNPDHPQPEVIQSTVSDKHMSPQIALQNTYQADNTQVSHTKQICVRTCDFVVVPLQRNNQEPLTREDLMNLCARSCPGRTMLFAEIPSTLEESIAIQQLKSEFEHNAGPGTNLNQTGQCGCAGPNHLTNLNDTAVSSSTATHSSEEDLTLQLASAENTLSPMSSPDYDIELNNLPTKVVGLQEVLEQSAEGINDLKPTH